ncbi:MAG TPA: zinc-dependent metalloprotease, partial [Bacteroidota bacterium]
VGGQQGAIFEPVNGERQREAMRFFVKEAFAAPAPLLHPKLLNLLEPSGVLARTQQMYQRILGALMNNARSARLLTIPETYQQKGPPYTLSAMLQDLQRGVWSELDDARIHISVYRRILQRTYLEIAESKFPSEKPDTPAGFEVAEIQSLLRQQLTNLSERITGKLSKAQGSETSAHLRDSLQSIKKILQKGISH